MVWTRRKLIERYLEFFKEKNHQEIVGSSLIPENDPTVLFITAGMHPLVPYLTGQKHPMGKRLVNVQKCIRTGDIEEVGDTFHHTFFEMLGNWSLGDYDKLEAIEYTFLFHTKILRIPLERYAVTVFGGNKDAPRDELSYKKWLELGVPKERIAFLEDNWWGPAGSSGPCGPDTEMFYYRPKNKDAPKKFDPKDKDWVEIGNDVIMEYFKEKDGRIIVAKQKNIDFGGGVERTIATLNGIDDNYLCDMWKKIIEKIEELSGKGYEGNEKEMRVIADHIKAAVMIINDGVIPSNNERGYVLRRLIRRAMIYAKKLGVESFTEEIARAVMKTYYDYKFEEEKILLELKKEEEKFNKTLESGMKMVEKFSANKKISGKDAFLLFQSYGLPIEMTIERARELGAGVDVEGYKKALATHQELSRTATAGKFKGGLADSSVETTRLHTTTHLLLAALNKVLGKRIEQKGSNITAERARFDFNFERKLTEEEVKAVEEWINRAIKTGKSVQRREMSLEEAKKQGAHGAFEDKYGKIVSVYQIEGISNELCGGPHVESLKELQGLKAVIFGQESVGAGVRRVKIKLEKE